MFLAVQCLGMFVSPLVFIHLAAAFQSDDSVLANIYVDGEYRCGGAHHHGVVLTTSTHTNYGLARLTVSLQSWTTQLPRDLLSRHNVTRIYVLQGMVTAASSSVVILKLDLTSPGGGLRLMPTPRHNHSLLFVGWGFESLSHGVTKEALGVYPLVYAKAPEFTDQGLYTFTKLPEFPMTCVSDGSPLLAVTDRSMWIQGLFLSSSRRKLSFVNLSTYVAWIKDLDLSS